MGGYWPKLDYSRERFTLDEGLNRAVNDVFIRLYNDGLIYRGESYQLGCSNKNSTIKY